MFQLITLQHLTESLNYQLFYLKTPVYTYINVCTS